MLGPIKSIMDEKGNVDDELKKSWENHEPAPLEYFHGKLMKLWHEYRTAVHGTPDGTPDCEINGHQLNAIIAEAKTETYKKYKNIINNKAIEKDLLKWIFY